jgi:hypothetical protein
MYKIKLSVGTFRNFVLIFCDRVLLSPQYTYKFVCLNPNAKCMSESVADKKCKQKEIGLDTYTQCYNVNVSVQYYVSVHTATYNESIDDVTVAS